MSLIVERISAHPLLLAVGRNYVRVIGDKYRWRGEWHVGTEYAENDVFCDSARKKFSVVLRPHMALNKTIERLCAFHAVAIDANNFAKG